MSQSVHFTVAAALLQCQLFSTTVHPACGNSCVEELQTCIMWGSVCKTRARCVVQVDLFQFVPLVEIGLHLVTLHPLCVYSPQPISAEVGVA
eukprot:6455126-Amphidinium_carterae.1